MAEKRKAEEHQPENPPKKLAIAACDDDEWDDEPLTQGAFDVMAVIEAIDSRNSAACKLISLNVQSIFVHSMDIVSDRILSMANFLALSETMSWERREVAPPLAGFVRIAEAKRVDVGVAGVAIFQNDSATIRAIRHDIGKTSVSYNEAVELSDACGDICAAEITVQGVKALLFCLYISADTTVKEKKFFITRNLYRYLKDPTPIILTGNFNLDMMKPENLEFVSFMERCFRLRLASDPTQATNIGGTCLDLTFCRNIQLKSKRYFLPTLSHRPILSVLEP